MDEDDRSRLKTVRVYDRGQGVNFDKMIFKSGNQNFENFEKNQNSEKSQNFEKNENFLKNQKIEKNEFSIIALDQEEEERIHLLQSESPSQDQETSRKLPDGEVHNSKDFVLLPKYKKILKNLKTILKEIEIPDENDFISLGFDTKITKKSTIDT